MEAVARGPGVLSEADFVRLQQGCRALFGVTIPEQKRGVAEARLRSLARRRGVGDLGSMVESFVSRRCDPGLRTGIVDALTTNHTYFMRETDHFDLLSSRVLPQLERERAAERDLRVWCAAAATGEEPWTLAMLLREHFGARYERWSAGLLATDISQRALAHARSGVYSEEDVAPLPPGLRQRYFDRTPAGDYRISDKLRDDVTLRTFNLARPLWPFRRPFDVVFCRNVLIYFAEPEMKAVLEHMAEVIRPGGWLFVGMAETLGRNPRHFELVQTGTYRRRS